MSDLPNPTVEPLLLPCPFCGETPDANNPATFRHETGDRWARVVCCIEGPEIRAGIYTPLEEWKDEAIAAWNERADNAERQRLHARIAELERANAELEAQVAGGLDTALADVVEWQHQQFPNANPEGITEHLLEEARELYDHPRDAEEVADVQLLLAGLASCLGINLADVVRAKLAKNKTRKWGKPNANGVIKHVEGGSDD
jgi:hypothetical protein